MDFDQAYDLLVVLEGGVVDHPQDPGGLTNGGVTQATYDAWRRRRGLSPQSVRLLTREDKRAIYRQQFWDGPRCDDLPDGLDLAVFDYGVNSGPGRAIMALQRLVGAQPVDGVIGVLTLDAVERAGDVPGLIERLCDERLSFMRRLPHWPTFGRGWSARVRRVRAAALGAAGAGALAPADAPVPVPRAVQADPPPWLGSAATMARDGALVGAGGAAGFWSQMTELQQTIVVGSVAVAAACVLVLVLRRALRSGWLG